MGNFILAIVLLCLALLAIALRRIYYYLPAKELKRQAETGDQLAATLWRAVSYDASLRILLWLWIGLATAGGFVLLAKIAPWPIAFTGTALLVWIAFAWFPRRSKLTTVEARLSAWLTPAIVWLLNYLHPIFDHTLAALLRRHPHDAHTSLYEADDLLELVERQKNQTDNRISTQQLEAAQRALTAHRYKVSDVLVPRDTVKSVGDGDTIGLVLLDELHATGQSSFPVHKGKTDKIIGTLYLHDVGLKTEGKVRDYMVNNVRYLHEDDSLHQALQAFFKTKSQLFVVINSFEEYVGVVTLESVVQALTGDMKVDDFDQHDDIAAVAGKHAHDDEEEELEPEVTNETAGLSLGTPALALVTSEPEMETITDEAVEEPEDSVDEPEPEAVPEPQEEPNPELVEKAAVEPTSADDDVTEEPAEDPEIEAVSMEDETDETDKPADDLDPDNLAALDLPDEPDADDQVGTHVTFDKPIKSKAKKSKPKTPESEDEVVS